MKAIKIKNYIVICLFLVFIFGISVFSILQDDRKISEMENRKLQQFPEFSYETLKSGDFTKNFETYMSDQVILKDELVSVKTVSDMVLQKRRQNGVYFGSDGYYLREFIENDDQIDRNIGLINSFAEKLPADVSVSFLLAPNAISVLGDKLPMANDTDDQRDALKHIEGEISDRITFVCPLDAMKNNSENADFYYRTDHHWTAKGAKFGFEKLMKAMGETMPNAEYESESLGDFRGTLYSQAPYAWAAKDEITLLTQKNNDITVTYTAPAGDHTVPEACEEKDGVSVKSGLFADELKDVKDKYAVFMGGNFTRIDITSEGAESDEHVLILKDSYCNTMMPYFCSKYKHITMCDLRYFGMDTPESSALIEELGIKKVICVYNIDFINSDNSFGWLA